MSLTLLAGCAKTSLARAAANSIACAWIALDGAALYSPFVGDAEATLRGAFRQARMAAPALVFLDEVDALVGARQAGADAGDKVQQRLLSTLLNEMDGIAASDGVLVVGSVVC